MNLKTQNMRRQRGRSVENGKYEWEWYDDPSNNYLVTTLFSRVTNLLGHNDNRQGEIR
jgi:cell fate regulator YaaT (PSP1 superfamily)